MKNVIKLAGEMSKEFETRKSDDGSEFVCLKGGAPKWMTDDVIRPVHDDKLPDDTTYRFIREAVDAISEYDDDATENDIQDRLNEIEPDVYTSDLTSRLNERADHVYYLTEALEGFDIQDGFDALSMAQRIQIDEVSSAVFEALKGIAEEV